MDQAISLPELKDLTIKRRLSQELISMKDALPDVPNYYADERLAQKIRHGQKISLKDLCDSNITIKATEKDQYLKLIDRDDDLIAIMQHTASYKDLKYACVFHKS